MFFLLSCSWKAKVVSYLSETIVVEDVIQFFGSNIKCFEYPESCASNILRRQSRTGELMHSRPGFHHILILVNLRGK